MFSSVFIVRPPVFFFVTWRLRTASMRVPFAALKRSLTCALTSRSLASTGSWMKAPPRVLGGCSPVVAYLRHSMIVCVCAPFSTVSTNVAASSRSCRSRCGRR